MKMKRILPILITVVMIGELLSPISLAAPGDVCEIWRGGAAIGSYADLSTALPLLTNGDTLKMLSNLDYKGHFKLAGADGAPLNITLDLGGRVLNVLGALDEYGIYVEAMSLSYANLSLANINGGALNLKVEPVDRGDGTYASLEVLKATRSTVTVNSIEVKFISVEASASGGYIVTADNSTVTVQGSVTVPIATTSAESGSESGGYRSSIMNSNMTVGGDFDCAFESGNAIITIDGDVSGTAEAGDGRLTIKGCVTADRPDYAALSAYDNAVVEVYGDVKNKNADGNGVAARGTVWPDVVKPAVTVRGGVEAGLTGVNCSIATVAVGGNVVSTTGTAIIVEPMSAIDIGGDVRSGDGPGVSVFHDSKTVVDGTITGAPYILFNDWPIEAERSKGEYDRNSGTGYLVYEHTFVNENIQSDNKTGSVWVKDAAAGDMAGIYNVQHSNAIEAKAYYDAGDTTNLTLYGEAGGTARTVVTYDNPLQSQTDETLTVVLTEGAAGLYKGSFVIAEGMNIKAVVFSLDGITGKTRAELPLSVSRLPVIHSALQVTVVNQYFAQHPTLRIVGTLTMASKGRGNSVSVDFTGAWETVAVPGLPIRSDYTLKMFDSDGFQIAGLDDVAVEAGQPPVSVTPELKASLTADFTFSGSGESDGWPSAKVSVVDTTAGQTVGSFTYNKTTETPSTTVLKGLDPGHEYKLSFTGGAKAGLDNKGSLTPYFYKPVISQTITAAPGANIVAFHMPDYAIPHDATIEGVVTLEESGLPVKGAMVSVAQYPLRLGYYQWMYSSATTDEDGRYSLPVFSDCETAVSVLRARTATTPPFEDITPVTGLNTLNITIAGSVYLRTDLRVLTRFIGDSGFSDVIWEGGTRWRPKVLLTNLSRSMTSEYNGEDYVPMIVKPGDQIRVKVTGESFIASLSIADVERILTVGDDYTIRDEIRMDQTSGAVLTLRVLDSEGKPVRSSWWEFPNPFVTFCTVTVRDTQSNKPVQYYWTNASVDVVNDNWFVGDKSDYALFVERPGTYEVDFFCRPFTIAGVGNMGFNISYSVTYRAKRTFTVYEGTIQDGGEVVLSQQWFPWEKDQDVTGSVTVSSSTAAPGATVTVKTNYAITDPSKPIAGNAAIILQLPPGTSYVPGSLTKNNVAQPEPTIDIATGRFEVSVAETDPYSGFVAFRMQIDPDIATNHIFTSAVIKWYIDTTVVGTAEIAIEKLTLDVPSYTLRRDIALKGLAPPGAPVTVYDRGLPIGATFANGAGKWGMNVILPGKDGVKYRHELIAVTEFDGKTLNTDKSIMIYDPLYPQIATLIVYEMNGARREMNVSGGRVSFPYLYPPGASAVAHNLKVSADFINPASADNVYICIEGDNGYTARSKAAYNNTTGLYDAVIIDAFRIVGAGDGASASIYAEYDLSDDHACDFSLPPDPDDLRNQLPSEISDLSADNIDFDSEVSGPDGFEPDTDDFWYDPHEDGTFELEPDSTTNFTGDFKDFYGSNGDFKISISRLLNWTPPTRPYATVTSGGWSANNVYSRVSTVGDKIIISGYAIVHHPSLRRGLPDVFLISWKATTNGKGLADAIGSGGPWEDINNMQDMLNDPCISADNRGRYKDALDGIARDTMALTASSGLLTVLGLFGGPPGYLISAAGQLIGYVGDKKMEQRRDKLAEMMVEDMANNEDCEQNEQNDPNVPKDPKDPSKPPNPRYPHNPPKPRSPGSGGNANWLHDPSGVIYEVTMDEPVDGATATLLYEVDSNKGEGQGTGEWVFFDMEWYEQVNPYFTLSDGWYEWDVPKGNWKVAYEKEGYKTEFSEEMYVPPIRLDVHQALESLSPPEVKGAYYADSRRGIEIQFDKYVKVSDVNASSVSVYTVALAEDGTALGGNEFLSGGFTPVSPVEYNGEMVAKSFIFTPDEALAAAKEYGVSFMPVIFSYAGIPLAADGTLNIAVTDPPPVAATGVSLDKDWHYLTLGDGPVKAIPTVKPDDAVNKSVTWKTSNPDIATVCPLGNITAVGPGVCYTTATTVDGGFEAYANVYVSAPTPPVGDVPVTGVTLNLSELHLTAGGPTAQLIATVLPADASNKRVIWSACDGSILTVSQTGVVTPLSAGSCVVTVRSQENSSIKADCVVRVYEPGSTIPVTGVTLDKTVLSLTTGGAAAQLTATISPADATDKAMQWSVSNTGIATVSQNGLVTPVGEGTCVVTVTTVDGAKTATCTVNVTKGGSTGGSQRPGGSSAPPSTTVPETPTIDPGTKPPLGSANPFSDVKEGDWFYDDVLYVYINNLMRGTSDDAFSPNISLTRGMAMTVLYRMEGEPDVTGLTNRFSDVPEGTWYTDAVKWAADRGIAQGYPDGSFGAEADITRQDLALILSRYAGVKDMELPKTRDYTGFNDDREIADYAKEAVKAFFEAGVINGKPANMFDPKGLATRAEFAVMIRRVMVMKKG